MRLDKGKSVESPLARETWPKSDLAATGKSSSESSDVVLAMQAFCQLALPVKQVSREKRITTARGVYDRARIIGRNVKRMMRVANMHAIQYPAPRNMNFWYVFGFMATIVLVNQIVTGIWLTMNYEPSADGS